MVLLVCEHVFGAELAGGDLHGAAQEVDKFLEADLVAHQVMEPFHGEPLGPEDVLLKGAVFHRVERSVGLEGGEFFDDAHHLVVIHSNTEAVGFVVEHVAVENEVRSCLLASGVAQRQAHDEIPQPGVHGHAEVHAFSLQFGFGVAAPVNADLVVGGALGPVAGCEEPAEGDDDDDGNEDHYRLLVFAEQIYHEGQKMFTGCC